MTSRTQKRRGRMARVDLMLSPDQYQMLEEFRIYKGLPSALAAAREAIRLAHILISGVENEAPANKCPAGSDGDDPSGER